MIPSSGTLEVAKSEVEEIFEQSEENEDETPYYEFEWFGLKYTYSKAGYWARIIFVIAMLVPLMLILIYEDAAGLALVMALFMFGAIGLSVVSLIHYQHY